MNKYGMTKKLLLALCMSAVSLSLSANEFVPSDNKKLAVEYSLENSSQETDDKFFKFTKDIEKIGFWVSNPHHNVQNVYKKTLGITALEQLSFSSMINDDKARVLFNKDPRLAGFTPFNLVIYRKKKDSQTVLTHIMPEAALDILQITDKDIRKSFIDMFVPLDAEIEKTFKITKKSYTKLHGFTETGMMNFEIPFDKPEDIDDFFDKFQQKFESTFEKKGYIIAGFYDMKFSLNSDKDVLPTFSNFVVWSLCHIPFSHTIFDGKDPMPEAAMFAPCSIYAYIKPGENKIVMGMPTLSAWAAALNITQKDKLEKIKQLDIEIPSLLMSLGAVRVDNTNPLNK
ncbi:MAG: hypothetical protein ACJAWW_000274 [Sulfurimonas sp.]|jgi:uncharacterized protein (DUF302 family)